MIDKKAVFVNTASQVIVRFITLAFTLISIKLLSNYLGTRGVGEYNTITTYINFFIVVADLGLFSVTVREISKDPNKEKNILSNVLIIRIISALLACVIAVSITYLTNYDSNIKIGVAVATGFLFFNLLGSVYDMVLQSRLKMQYSALSEFISKALTILALYVVILMKGDFLHIISTVALSGFLIFIFKYYFAVRYVKFTAHYNKSVSNWIFNLAWPIGMVFIMNNLFLKLDTLMLFVIKGGAAVGIYTVAYKILEVTAFFATYFANSLKPTISQHISDNKPYIASIVQKGFSIMLMISAPVAIICVVFSKEIILFLSNQDFLSGSNALVMLGFTLPIIYFDVLMSEILIANDERKLLIRIAIFMVLFNFLINLYFIPAYSFMGAAFTTLLSEIVLFGINYHYTKKIIPYNIDFSSIIKVMVVSALTLIVGISIRGLDVYFIWLILLIAAIYFILSYIFKLYSLTSIRELIQEER